MAFNRTTLNIYIRHYGLSDITNNEEDKWICEICEKSTYDVEDDYIGSGTNHLGCELKIEMGEKDDKTLYEDMGDGHLIKGSNIKTEGFEFPTKGNWIYESTDGGETIYRRKMGKDNREKIEKGL